ncbi:unnamed protein product [Angiostrongylus costaricensis]|uniref:NADH dehydrogenase subunit 2 n=1 Tax=Angiostrongylus costaricensis TaxID=334426 RepID=A0A0R3Q128_ANGCS|nr:unnamed protein product [Angiostrongylus costaricensis]
MRYRRIFNYFVLQESLGLVFLLLFFSFFPVLIIMIKIGIAPFHFWLFKVVRGMYSFNLVWILVISSVESFNWVLVSLSMSFFNVFYLIFYYLFLIMFLIYKFDVVGNLGTGFRWELVLVFMNMPFRLGFFIKIMILIEFLKSFGIYLNVIMMIILTHLFTAFFFLMFLVDWLLCLG